MGVLITGKPGIGKSNLAVNLLNRGHRLISDDATDIYLQQRHLLARCPPTIRGQLWLRNAGMLDATLIWGHTSIKVQQRLDLIVYLLDNLDDLAQEKISTQTIFSMSIPRIISIAKQSSRASHIEDLCSKKN